MLRKISIVAGILTLVVTTAPTPTFAGGNLGGSKNRTAGSYHCKSGHVVRNAKACKENGGTR
ncbi:MAG TPA: hypothetical protein VHL13_14240 [Pseudolabrys sp.]|jgi:hypothetical protein|nr:hypothetical protein [Pseudolabrys sp.]